MLAGFLGATRLEGAGLQAGLASSSAHVELEPVSSCGRTLVPGQGAAALIGASWSIPTTSPSPHRPPQGLAIWAFTGLAIQTFAEEFVFRGYVTQALLLASRRPAVAALFSGLLFGALHIPNGTPQAIWATCFGVVAALIAIRTGGLAFTYGLHLANNLFAGVIVVSTGDVFKGIPGVITQSTPQIMGWDVGVGVAAMLGALMLAYRLSPRPSSARR